MTSPVNANFFSYLLKEKTSLSLLDKEEEKEMWRIAQDFLYSGFLMDSLNFNKLNSELLNKLERHNKAFFINYLIMKKSLVEISKKFNREKISFVVLKGMALNIEKIFLPGIRQHRDIDLLVKKEDIDRAYNILRELKFKYCNPETSDNADYLLLHQLPAMRNEHGIILELHHRITDVNLFKKCPLTNSFFEEKKESRLMKGVFIPSLDCLIAHTLYHGIKHHKFTHGPIFLFDLSAIYKFNENKWPKDFNLINKLGLLLEFEKCKKIISATNRDNKFSYEVQGLIKELLGEFSWSSKVEEISLLGFSNKRFSYRELFFKFKRSFTILSYEHQLSKISFKYWVMFFKKLIHFVKRVRL
tara:strand:+ start:1253 stop:2326 length:1074 start_codon:yes stop_codon:yes gene_type:complete